MKNNTTTAIKVILILTLIVCLFKWSYGVYMLCRTIIAIGFGVLAYNANKEQRDNVIPYYVILVVIFQPLIKIPFGRALWQVIDVVVIIGLIYSMIKPKHKQIN